MKTPPKNTKTPHLSVEKTRGLLSESFIWISLFERVKTVCSDIIVPYFLIKSKKLNY